MVPRSTWRSGVAVYVARAQHAITAMVPAPRRLPDQQRDAALRAAIGVTLHTGPAEPQPRLPIAN
jgi:hypothetical protein